MSGRTIGFAVTGSFCTHEKIKKVIEELVNQGEKVIPVFSPICPPEVSKTLWYF